MMVIKIFTNIPKSCLKIFQVDSEDMKSIKRQYLRELDEVARNYKNQKQSSKTKEYNNTLNTSYNAKAKIERVILKKCCFTARYKGYWFFM